MNLSDKLIPSERYSFPLHIYPFAVGNLLGGIVVSIFNAIILCVTIRSKNLRGNCNILIGVLAAVDLVTGLCFIEQGILILSNQIYFTRRACALLWALFFLSIDTGNGLVLAVGIDRFTSLTYPIWYKSLNRRLYFGTIVTVCSLYGVSVSLAGVISQRNNDLVVTCIPPMALSKVPFYYWILTNLLINIAVVIVYILAFLRVRSLRDQELSASAGREVSRKTELKHNLMLSLVVVMLVYIFSWLSTVAIVGSVRVLPISPAAFFHVTAYCGWLVLVNVGSNFVIYFSRSDLYRGEVLRLFRRRIPRRRERNAPPSQRLATVPLIAYHSQVQDEARLSPRMQCYGTSMSNVTHLSPMMYEQRDISNSPSHCDTQY